MNIEFDENGTPLCPLEHGEVEWDDEGDRSTVAQRPCRAELALIVGLRITPGEGDPSVLQSDMTHDNAVTSSWRFECNNGHVLATSCEEETAEDFQWLTELTNRAARP